MSVYTHLYVNNDQQSLSLMASVHRANLLNLWQYRKQLIWHFTGCLASEWAGLGCSRSAFFMDVEKISKLSALFSFFTQVCTIFSRLLVDYRFFLSFGWGCDLYSGQTYILEYIISRYFHTDNRYRALMRLIYVFVLFFHHYAFFWYVRLILRSNL